jgi:hypothetical protein
MLRRLQYYVCNSGAIIADKKQKINNKITGEKIEKSIKNKTNKKTKIYSIRSGGHRARSF